MLVTPVMRALAVTLLAAGLVLCATACGGDALTLDPVASAATKTSGQGGKYTMTIDLTKLGKSQDAMKIDADGTFDGDGNMTMHMDLEGTPMDAVAVNQDGDTVMYMKSSAFDSLLPQGKTWIEMNLSKLYDKAGFDAKVFQSPGSDPTQVLDMLGKASDGVQKVGDGTVVGVHATHYRANLDLTKAAELAGVPGKQAEQLGKVVAGSSIPVDVWIDDQGFLREVDEHLHLNVKGQKGDGEITFQVTDVGTQPAIEAPPADQAYDVTDQIPSS